VLVKGANDRKNLIFSVVVLIKLLKKGLTLICQIFFIREIFYVQHYSEGIKIVLY